MFPSDQYFKSKRAGLFFSCILLISVFSGLEPTQNSILSIKLSNPSFLKHILAVISIYYAFQLAIFWETQDPEIRRSPHFKVDFYFSFSVILLGFMSYIVQQIPPLVTAITELAPEFFPFTPENPNDQPIESIFDTIFQYEKIIALFTAAASGYVALYLGIQVRLLINKRRKESQNTERLLTSFEWKMVFNPDHPRGSKILTFLTEIDPSNGRLQIGEGKNNNETTWSADRDILEIFNHKNELFSRFKYNKNIDEFENTNDDDTLSIRNQRIYKNSKDK